MLLRKNFILDFNKHTIYGAKYRALSNHKYRKVQINVKKKPGERINFFLSLDYWTKF